VITARVFQPEYSFVSNAISDLGNTACMPNSNIRPPLYVVMDASIAIPGLAMMVGSILIFSEFRFSNDRRETCRRDRRIRMAGITIAGK
jgi:hypothetical membrane protein